MDNVKREIKVNHYNFQINAYKTSESQNVVYNKTFILTDSVKNISKSSGSTTVIISNCTFKGKVKFNLDLIDDSVEIFFENCDFQYDFFCENLEKDNLEKLNISFKHCLLHSFQVYSKKCGRLTFTDSYLLDGLKISQCKFSFFEYCDSYSVVSITNSQCNSWRFIKNLYLYKEDRNKRFHDLTKDMKLENKITISDQANVRVQTIHRTEENVSYEIQPEWKLEYKSLNLSLLDKCDVFLLDASIDNFTLMSCNSIDFRLLSSSINTFTMSNVSPEKMNINNLKPFSEKNSKLKILNSVLENTTFHKLHLPKYEFINIYSSNIANVEFYSTTIPNHIVSMDPNGVSDMSDEYENYRQIKVSMNRSFNKLQEFEVNPIMLERFRKRGDLNWQDKFILFLNKISNNHGSSILLPFVWFLGLVLIFTSIVFIVNSQYYAPHQYFDTMLYMSNPFHRIQNINEIYYPCSMTIKTNILISSFLSRVFISWILYQFISVFRRFGKNI